MSFKCLQVLDGIDCPRECLVVPKCVRQYPGDKGVHGNERECKGVAAYASEYPGVPKISRECQVSSSGECRAVPWRLGSVV